VGLRPSDDLVLSEARLLVLVPLAALAGKQAGEGVAAGQTAEALFQRLVDVHPRLARRAVDLPPGAEGPAARAGAVGVGPRQDLRHGQGRPA